MVMSEFCRRLEEQLDAASDDLRSSLSSLREECAELNDEDMGLIEKSLEHILADLENGTAQNRATKGVWEARVNGARIFARALRRAPNQRVAEVERQLFRAAFAAPDCLPAYLLHDQFLEANSAVGNLDGSRANGKSTCTVFFCILRALLDGCETRPYVVISLGVRSVRDALTQCTYYKTILGDSVRFFRDEDFMEVFDEHETDKPVVFVLRAMAVLELLGAADRKGVDLIGKARFIIDSVYQRIMPSDTLCAVLAEKIIGRGIPLHVSLLSALGDKRVLDIFEDLQTFELPYSEPFEVVHRTSNVASVRDLDASAVNEVQSLVKEMISGKLQLGHILVITSTHDRIRKIMELIERTASEWSSEETTCKVLAKLDRWEQSKEIFYNMLDDRIGSKVENSIYIFPIKYAGPCTNTQRELVMNPITGYDNIVKIICSTGYIDRDPETICNLAAVIDCGIAVKYWHCGLDTDERSLGISRPVEIPESEQNRMRRRGKVGRTRSGVSVDLRICEKYWQSPPFPEPEYWHSEDSAKILRFREHGVTFEKLSKFPAPGMLKGELSRIIHELVHISALDNTSYELTQRGMEISQLYPVQPTFGAAIIEVANLYGDDSCPARLMGSLVAVIINGNNFWQGDTSNAIIFQRHYSDDSDLLTLIGALLEVMTRTKGINYEAELGAACRQIVEIVSLIALRLHEENPWTVLESFFQSHNMIEFLDRIFSEIQKLDPDWIACRHLTFSRCDRSGVFQYNCRGRQGRSVTVHSRPGAKGLAMPRDCLVLQLKENQYGLNGSMVHRKGSSQAEDLVMICEAPWGIDNAYAVPMVEAYIGSSDGFDMFIGHGRDKQHAMFIQQQWMEKVVLSYRLQRNMSKNSRKLSNKMVEEAVAKVGQLAPFTPRCILVQHELLKVVVAVFSTGAHIVTTKVFSQDDPCIAYKIDRYSIDYLLKNQHLLSASDGSLLIAITGQSFADLSDPFVFPRAPKSERLGQSKYVFDKTMSPRMVILSEQEIPNGTRLSWEPSSTDDCQSFLTISNTICRGFARFSHTEDMIFATKNQSKVVCHGWQCSQEVQTVTQLFQQLALSFIRDNELIQDVQLDKFTVPGLLPQRTIQSMMGDSESTMSRIKSGTDLNRRVRGRTDSIPQLPTVPDTKTLKVLFVRRGYICSELMHTAENIQILRDSGLCDSVEKIPLVCVRIPPVQTSSLTSADFMRIINRICDRLGAVVQYRSDQRARVHTVTLYTGEFAPVFASELMKALSAVTFPLIISPRVLPTPFLSRQDMINCISDWIETNELDITQKGTEFYGVYKEILKAQDLLRRPGRRPDFPIIREDIPGGLNADLVAYDVRSHHQGMPRESQWAVDRTARQIIAVYDADNDESRQTTTANIKKFLDGQWDKVGRQRDEALMADYIDFYGPEAPKSSTQIAVYRRDGSFEMQNFSASGAHNLICHCLGRYFDESAREPNVDILDEVTEKISPIEMIIREEDHDEWPALPLGQVIWSLTSDTFTASATRTWLVATVQSALHNSPLFTYCPQHPDILLRVSTSDEEIKCSIRDCPFHQCKKCGVWHQGNCIDGISAPGIRMCPKCKREIEKTKDCIVMHCTCGAFFCYYCGGGPFKTDKIANKHARVQHQSLYNDPPDYKRYFLHDPEVTDEDIAKFYEVYPQLRPIKPPQ